MQYIHYVLLLLRLLLLAVSFCGYLNELKKRIRIEFAVGVLFSGIGSILFLAGILHILREAAWVICAGGIVLCVKAWRKRPACSLLRLKDFLTPGMIFGSVMAVFFMVLLFRSELLHYDNFSHWALASNLVIKKDMFPNTADRMLHFTSYPLGHAMFPYYITEILGSSQEWILMWAQAVLMVGMLVGLFAFRGGVVCTIATCLTAMMLLCGNTHFTDMLVDTLLPLTAVAGIAFCSYYRSELDKKIWYVIPYAVFLVSVKNSGALFAVFLLGYAFYCIPKTRESCKRWLIAAVFPVATVFFWNRHVEQVFDNGAASKHAMRMDNFLQILSEKSTEDIVEITKHYSNAAVRDGGRILLFVLILGILLIIVERCILKKPCRVRLELVALAAVSYILYHIGTYGMYILSMPIEEARFLAGYERYHQTIVVFVSGILLIALLKEIDRIPRQRGIIAVALAICTAVISSALIQPHYHYYSRQKLENTERAKFDRLISDYAIPPEERYLILVSEERNDAGYLYHMTQYLLSPEAVTVAGLSDLESIQDPDFNYVIMFEDTEANAAYLQEQFGTTEEVAYIEDKPII